MYYYIKVLLFPQVYDEIEISRRVLEKNGKQLVLLLNTVMGSSDHF
jgi:hypothetical protein